MTIEYKTIDSTRTYHIIFDKRRGDWSFWNIFTRDGFDHVWLLTDIHDRALAIKPTPSGCELDLWDCNVRYALNMLPEDITAVLRYTVEYKSLSKLNISCILSCVSYTKYLLKLRGFLILTPKRLFKQLLKQNAEILKWKSESLD